MPSTRENTIIFSMDTLEIKAVSKSVIDENINAIRNQLVDNTKEQELLVSVKLRRLEVMSPLSFLIEEICDCLLTEKYVAATTTTNLLLENALKLALIIYDSKGKTLDDGVEFEYMYEKEVKDNIDNILNRNINRAYDVELVDQSERDELIKLKNKFRNPFSHGSHNEEIKRATTVIYTASIDPSNIQKRKVPVRSQPFLYYRAQEVFCKREAMNYFLSVYAYIDLFDRQLINLYNK
jgi:hypothetical protein